MRIWGIALLLPLVAAAGEEEAEIVLPVASMGVPGEHDEPDDVVIFEVDSLGRLLFRHRARTLDELGTILDRARRVYNLKMKAKGRSGEVEVAPGVQASRLFVRLRVHKDAPWQHVQWLMTTMAERRFHKLQFAVTRAAGAAYGKEEAEALGAERDDEAETPPEAELRSFLPTDTGRYDPGREGEQRIPIDIVPRTERETVWGPAEARRKITMPTAVRYRCGEREAATLEEVFRWVEEGVDAAAESKLPVRGEIRAGRKVPFKFVVAVLDRFRKAGVGRVDFHGTQIPTPEVRRRRFLPYPKKNSVTTDEGSPR